MIKQCKLCGESFETLQHGGKRMYCFKCSPQGTANVITILRHRAKEIGLQKLGGKCQKCGITKSYLLDFHHRDPNEKEGELSDFSKGYNLDAFFNELEKCDLLCANCHREFHYLYSNENLSYENYLKS